MWKRKLPQSLPRIQMGGKEANQHLTTCMGGFETGKRSTVHGIGEHFPHDITRLDSLMSGRSWFMPGRSGCG